MLRFDTLATLCDPYGVGLAVHTSWPISKKLGLAEPTSQDASSDGERVHEVEGEPTPFMPIPIPVGEPGEAIERSELKTGGTQPPLRLGGQAPVVRRPMIFHCQLLTAN